LNFCGNGCHIRDARNTRQYCNNRCGSSCYGGFHRDGEVLMGAMYKVRVRLNNAYGDAAGDLISDTLFIDWMNGYNDGNICADGEEGNICVQTEPRPIGLFAGYWQDDDRTAEVFQHGWYYTGDRAYRDEDGYLWFVGRADDVILSAAYRIGPFEVESSLIEHPAVAETAVVGKPDPDRGNIVKAFIILAPDHEPSDALTAEIQEHVKTTTAPYKYPREIEYVDELPKTISGKIRRVELRERDS
jgi:acyl-coenzyme A synthetase/AMP-(fatty) acid ligase